MHRTVFILLVFLFSMIETSAEEVNLSDWSIEQKVGQMFIVRGDFYDDGFLDIGVGGIFLDSQKYSENYSKLVAFYQNGSKIKLFVASDMEGYWNPFSDFYDP